MKPKTYTSEELAFKPKDAKPISKEAMDKARDAIIAYRKKGKK